MKLSEFVRQAAADRDLPIVLEHYGLAPLLKGEQITLYHGSTKTFAKFDMAKSRAELVNNYYGIGLFFTPSKRVAWRYADANRNIGFDPEIVDDMKRVNRNAGDFLEELVKKGKDAWDDLFAAFQKKYPGREVWEIVPEHFAGIDPNDLDDVAGYVLGSKTRPLGGDGPINIFNVRTGLPDHLYGTLDTLGLDSKKYRPKVYTVKVSAKNVLVTKSKTQARSARRKGYDAVIFTGADLVDGVPEVAVFDPSRVQITHVETE